MTPTEAGKQLAQICADAPEFMTGFDRSGTAAVVAEALTTLLGKRFIVCFDAYEKQRAIYKIVPACSQVAL